MKSIDWGKWAAISEVFGTAAVVVSLIFVAFSIRQNTAVVQADQQNLLYELTDALYADWATNPELYELYEKGVDPEALSSVERQRITDMEYRGLSVWENAYFKHQNGLLSDEQYEAWHDANVNWIECCMHKWIWDEIRKGTSFRAGFIEMVDAIQSGK